MIKKILPGVVVCLVLLLIASQVLAVEGTRSGSKLDKTLTSRAAKYIDVNQIRSSVINNGTFTRHPITGNSDMEWPKGTGKYICYNAGIWVSGRVANQVRTACADYNVEYQPGLILPDGTPDDPEKADYRVFKAHKDYPNGDATLEIDTWDTWKTIAEQQQGAPPVSDAEGKWIGLGDEMLYAVMNDLNQTLHGGCYNTLPIGVELHLLVFAFDRSGALGNSVFSKYTLINKGQKNLEEAYIGAWSDVDNGDANDDLIGYDLNLGMAYCYGGKPIDATYGDRPPALGWDFFQGPIVDSPGDTVRLPDGRVLPNKRKLDATSFNKYYNGNATYSDPPYSATGAQQVWNYLSGKRKDGADWINPLTGEVTSFVNTGDPVTGTGWISTKEAPPSDVRLLIGSGPFTLAVGDTQEIVLGCVIAQGGDRLSSVSLLRVYDKQLQQAYDLGFQVPSPPLSPAVTVTELDKEILLTWGQDAENYNETGYGFEGYNIYIGSSIGGPWKRLETFDIEDGILAVFDEGYDENTNTVLSLPSAFGKDLGLKYQYSINKDYNGFTLANGRTYYVVVTSYSAGVESTPRVLESSRNVINAVPHQPRPGTVVTHKAFENVNFQHIGTADTTKWDVWVQLMDPLYVETADYEIKINEDQSWTLLKNGATVPAYTSVTEYGFDTDITNRTAYQNKGIDFFLGVDANFSLDPISTFLPKLISTGSDPTMITALTSPSRLGQFKTDLAKDGIFKKGTKSEALLYNALQIRFTGDFDPATKDVVSGGSMATFLFWFGDPGNFKNHPKNPTVGGAAPFLIRVPFEVYDMTRNVKLNVAFTDNKQKLADADFVPTWAPRGECRVYIFASEYDEQIHNCGYTGTDTLATWTFIYGANTVWTKGDIVELSFPQPLPVTGKEMTVTVKGKPVTLQPDRFKFSIKGQQHGVAEDARQRLDIINVYPNPYLAYNLNERGLHQENVVFINLPAECTIRIFSTAGQLIRTLEHSEVVATGVRAVGTMRW
ncbi:MAG: hypothetical protein L0Z73_15480, partial [Gammaproteobacteria bacterium]|nr:hypothetical protein [Gammaproteobacteria bacterium]